MSGSLLNRLQSSNFTLSKCDHNLKFSQGQYMEDAWGGRRSREEGDYHNVNTNYLSHVFLKTNHRRIGVQPSKKDFNWKKL